MGGKVIVSTREHVARLIAARLQADVMGSDLIILARTDALSARLIDNNIDPVDQPWIQGIVDKANPSKLLTYPEAGQEVIARTFNGKEREEVELLW